MSKITKICVVLLSSIIVCCVFAACEGNGGDAGQQTQGAGHPDSTTATNETVDVSSLPPSSEGLSFRLNNDEKSYTVTGIGKCTDKDIVIGSYQNLPVTSIEQLAFAHDDITSVTIGDGVTSIGKQAFYQCYELKSVTIGNAATDIGDSAFQYCSALTDATIGNRVTSIGNQAFSYCNNLKNLTIENGVKSIGEEAFMSAGLTTIVIPDSVTSIGNRAFNQCDELTSVTIGNGVTSIGEETFNACTALTDVNLGNGVTSIGNSAFIGCGIVNMTIPDSVTTIGEGAFRDCNSLTSIVIPDSVTSIGDGAFYPCGSLMKVTLGKNLTTIGAWAFGGCDGLYEIVNHSSLELSIGSGKNGNVALNAYVIIDNSGNKTYRSGYDETTYIATDDGFRFICEYTIYGEAKYKLIGYIGSPCTVTLPTDINGNPYTLYRVKGLTDVAIPDGTTSINYEAFDSTSMKSVTIPKSVTSIESDAFPQFIQGGLASVYYVGTADEWAQIAMSDGNYGLTAATCYFFAETQPTDTEGNYWHYVDNVPTPW